MKLPSPTEDFYGTQNTSNNGYRYVPGENETEGLSDNVYQNLHSILKKPVIKSSPSPTLCSCEVSDTTDAQRLNIDQAREIEDTNIDIVIAQDVASGWLFFDVIAIDELQSFTETNRNRKILAVTGSAQTVLSNGDVRLFTSDKTYPNEDRNDNQSKHAMLQQNVTKFDEVNQTASWRKSLPPEEAKTGANGRPGEGDHLNHTPGILHVPNINLTSSKDRRKVKFQSADECYQDRRGRFATRHYDANYQRNRDARNREFERYDSKGRKANVHVSKSPSQETNEILSARYYNSNTYYTSPKDGTRPSRQVDIKQKPTLQSSDGLVKNNKTGVSHSEGDLIRNRFQRSRDRSSDKKNIRNEMKNIPEIVEPEQKRVMAKKEDGIITGPTGDFAKDRNNQNKPKVSTKSVAQTGLRPRPEKHDHQEKNDDVIDDKQKKKRKRNRSNRNKKIEKPQKTKIQILQHQIELGQLKSFFSKYKTAGLRNITLLSEMHEGTYSTKYKASYHNELSVLDVYSDQDVSDIAAVDMAHMRGSYFVQSLKDCIRGPSASLWLLAPYYRLGDLQKLLLRDESRHVFGERHAQFITAGLLLAIQYLHKNNIVHGNIKPSKILLSNQGFPVLTGFLKLRERPTAEKRDVYTPAYAAPERFRGERGQAVDVFSIGCIAYEIITGSTPFDGDNVDGTKIKILSSNYQPWFEPELISFAGEEFLELCLKKKASERFRLSENMNNMKALEWFTRLDFSQLRRQVVHSPILDAIQLLNNHAKLSWEEKGLNYNWGCVMDEISPDKPCIGD